MASYTATIQWIRNTKDSFTDNRYSRGHTWSFDGGTAVPASASPHIVPLPYSIEANVDPEEAFVASISSCHMLLILFFTLFLFVNPALYAQETPGTVRGSVYDAESNEPLISATIFLSGTTIGVASDKEGNFTLRNVPPGIYELVVRYIGYEQITQLSQLMVKGLKVMELS